MFLRAAFLLILLLALGAYRVANAQQIPCAPTEAMAAQIAARWKEVPAFEGIVSDKARMVLFVNAESRTWTILVAQSDGTSCVLLSGSEGDIVQPAKRPGDPT